LIISAAYQVALGLSHPILTGKLAEVGWSQSPLNPAVALGMMSFAMFEGDIKGMHFAWIYLVFSWFGSILALVCFEYVFRKAQNTVEVDEEKMEEHAEEEEVEKTLLAE